MKAHPGPSRPGEADAEKSRPPPGGDTSQAILIEPPVAPQHPIFHRLLVSSPAVGGKQLLAMPPAHSIDRPVLEHDLAIPVGAQADFLDVLGVDERRAMDANEARGVELLLHLG